MALPEYEKLTKKDLECFEKRADDSIKDLPEGPEKDSYVAAFADLKLMTWAFMTYNGRKLGRLTIIALVIGAMLFVVGAGGAVLAITQANHNHQETVARIKQGHRETLEAALRAKQTIQQSRLASSYTACIQQKIKRRKARRHTDIFIQKLADHEITSFKAVGRYLRQNDDDITVSQVKVPLHIPADWVSSCRAHAQSVVNSPNTQFPPPPPA